MRSIILFEIAVKKSLKQCQLYASYFCMYPVVEEFTGTLLLYTQISENDRDSAH